MQQNRIWSIGRTMTTKLVLPNGQNEFPGQDIPATTIRTVELVYGDLWADVAGKTDELLANVLVGDVPESDFFDESRMGPPDEKYRNSALGMTCLRTLQFLAQDYRSY